MERRHFVCHNNFRLKLQFEFLHHLTIVNVYLFYPQLPFVLVNITVFRKDINGINVYASYFISNVISDTSTPVMKMLLACIQWSSMHYEFAKLIARTYQPSLPDPIRFAYSGTLHPLSSNEWPTSLFIVNGFPYFLSSLSIQFIPFGFE